MESDILSHFREAKLFDTDRFHWFGWHFLNMRPLARDIVATLATLEARASGCARRIAMRIGEAGGKEKYTPHYEQLIQMLCELVIARRLCEVFSADAGYELVWEPTGSSAKNPEFVLKGPTYDLFVEVKCPSILNHAERVAENDVQLLTRLGDPAFFDAFSTSGTATRPLDNRIKDFLVSAEGKFATFDRGDEKPHFSLLVICWTERMFEAVSPLINEASGLLTERSFHRAEGRPVIFPNVDGILVTPHVTWLIACTKEVSAPGIYESPLDYGTFGPGVPLTDPVYIVNPHSAQALPKEVVDAFYGAVPDPLGDPMSAPLDMIFWLGGKPRKGGGVS